MEGFSLPGRTWNRAGLSFQPSSFRGMKYNQILFVYFIVSPGTNLDLLDV